MRLTGVMPAGKMALGITVTAGGDLPWLVGMGRCLGPPSGPVTLIIHNELDRPVLGFSVNGVAGLMPLRMAGATCCGSISGDKAEVIWTLDITHAQYLKGMRLETRRTEMPMPVRKKGRMIYTFIFCRAIKSCWDGVIMHGRLMKSARTERIQIKWKITNGY